MITQINKNSWSYIAICISVVLLFLTSCGGGQKSGAYFEYDPQTIPTIDTDSVTTLVSDSGIIRYKMVAKTWETFDKAKEPYQYFPNGFYGEQFDSLFNIVVTVRCDTLWYFDNKELCRLKGDVVIRNIANEEFKSEELFWDRRAKTMYSDEYIVIDRPGKLRMHAKGFKTDEQFNAYDFYDAHETDIYVKENTNNSQNEEEKTE